MTFGKLILTRDSYYPYQRGNNSKLIKTAVTGTILHSFSTLSFIQEFKTLSEDYYSIYINPPEGCVIYDVKGQYNDKLTEFVVHKLEEPVSNCYYDSNSNSDAINLTLGKIPNDTIVIITIKCTFTALLSSQNSFSFVFPIDEKIKNSVLTLDLDMNMQLEKPSKIQTSEGSLKIKHERIILPPTNITKDFQITFSFSNQIKSQAFSTKIDQFNYLGLSLVPDTIQPDIEIKQEIYLLIDCSGSMVGSKIIAARNALINFLQCLPKNCYFNILRFGSEFEQMFESSVENNKKNIKTSLKFAQNLEANLGGTEIYSPLMSIINEKPKKGYLRQVFAITDGEVNSPANVIAACTANRHIMRVFPFGIGHDVNHAFIKELAKSTNGEEHFITDDKSHKITQVVLEALKSSQVPVVVNTQMHIEGVDTFETAPYPVPSLFQNKLAHVVVRYDGNHDELHPNILINGECGNSNYENAITAVNVDPAIDFHKLFAYHNIRDMEDRMINTENKDDAEVFRENIVRLSIQSEIVSSFTGFFTVINGVEQKPEEQYNQECMHQDYYDQYDQYECQQCCYQDQYNYCQMEQCQQVMTQKQCRNQEAFAHSRSPIQQAKKGWAGAQMQQSQATKIIQNQKKSSLPPSPPQTATQQQSTKQILNDQFLQSILDCQNADGSWSDLSLIQKLIYLKKQDPTIENFFEEYPKIQKEMKNLTIECIITLLVIGWLYSKRKCSATVFENHAEKGVLYLKSNTKMLIHNDPSKNANLTKDVNWKS
ncbi:von Willebrand factor A domain-containing protein 5A [Tritrichomonas musculus]|uniref:von Willebrand factor A domain-containing protein 5A n=1 Tax=Tritrichomonas musculus TaxID=1915356 RepID=A0ABR2GXU8_9EUKA